MKFSLRIGFFILLSVCVLYAPFAVFFAGAVLYAAFWFAPELILLALVIDATFGMGVATFPFVYTVSTGMLVIVLELLKPHLLHYES